MLGRLAWGLTFLPAAAFAPRSILGTMLFEPDGALVPAKPLPPNPFMRDGKALVAIVRGEDPLAMLHAGLNLIGGIGRLGLHGKRDLAKPNGVNNRPPPSTTHPKVVAAVVRLVREAGAQAVTVAERSGLIRLPSSGNPPATCIKQAAESAGASVLAFEEEPW